MNAPISAALLQLRATNAAPAVDQPEIPAGLVLLLAAYQFKALRLDLYGVADATEGCTVEAVALAGATVDLASVFSLAQLTTMGWAVDKAGVETRAASRIEDRADRAAWDKAATP